MGRPASVGAGPRPPTVGTPEENSAKRIKMEENSRKSGHVSFIQKILFYLFSLYTSTYLLVMESVKLNFGFWKFHRIG